MHSGNITVILHVTYNICKTPNSISQWPEVLAILQEDDLMDELYMPESLESMEEGAYIT